MPNRIEFMDFSKANWKYTLLEDYVINLAAYPLGNKIKNTAIKVDKYLTLSNQILTIHKEYSWDGASGPTVDTPDCIRASLVHDALYQLIGEMAIPLEYRNLVDDVLYTILREDGMSWFRAKTWRVMVGMFGEKAAKEDESKDVYRRIIIDGKEQEF